MYISELYSLVKDISELWITFRKKKVILGPSDRMKVQREL